MERRATHRCRLKNRKSRWLCRVTTCRPWNSGSWGKVVWNIRPTAWPSRVTKLFNTSSGWWGVARACPYGHPPMSILWIRQSKKKKSALTYICLVSSIDVSLKYAEGPLGRWTKVIASKSKESTMKSIYVYIKYYLLGFFMFSFTTHRCLYPRSAAHPAIRPISNPLPFFRCINSPPGKTPTNSSQKS